MKRHSCRKSIVPGLLRWSTSATTRGALYLVMGHTPGDSLAVQLQAGRMELPAALIVGRCLFSALSDLHQRRILHRGIKPSNVILGSATLPITATLVGFGPGCETNSESLLEENALETALLSFA